MAAGFPTKANYASGDVLTAANMNDLAGTVNLIAPTAKGDLFPGSAANTVTKLAVGTNGHVLTADSSTATGMKWAAAGGASGGLVRIASSTFSATSSVAVNNCFSATYSNYMIVGRLHTSSSDTFYRNRVSGTSASTNYNYQKCELSNGSSFSVNSNQNSLNLTSNSLGAYWMTFVLYVFSPAAADATGFQNATTRANGAYTSPATFFMNGNHSTATAYDGFEVFTTSGTTTGTITVYGLADS